MCFKTILVLDSNVQRRTQLHYTLSLHGYKVIEAANSRDAEDILSIGEIPVDLVIREPGGQFDLKWPTWRRYAPILLLTVSSESQRDDSPDDFWRLSFDPEELLSRIGSALAQTAAGNVFSIDDKRRLENDRDVHISNGRIEPGSAGRILMVEDDEFLRSAVSKTLRHHGFTVMEAGDGPSALALFAVHESEIDVVLLDITLPSMSGQEVFHALQQIRPDVKVIVTTAHCLETIMSTMGIRQPSAFVRKPYHVTELAQLIRTVQKQKSRE